MAESVERDPERSRQTAFVKAAPHHVLLRLKVTGGFMGGADLVLADGLNCLIGGRGAGKTTALEFLRFALGLMPDPKVNQQRVRALDALIKANLGGGRVAVELRTKTGMLYTAGRGTHESVQVLNESGTAVPISLDRDQIFTADVFSQNEIEDIASSPAAQLELLDRFNEQSTARIVRDLAQLFRELEQSTATLRQLDTDIDDLRGKASEITVLEEKLRALSGATGPDAERTNAAHRSKAARVMEAQFPQLVLDAMQSAARETESTYASFSAALDGQAEQLAQDGVNTEAIALFQQDVQSFKQALADARDRIAEAALSAQRRFREYTARLAERHAIQESEYRALIVQLEEEGGRAAERLAFQTALAEAQAAARALETREKQRLATLSKRRELLQHVSELRDERFLLRKRTSATLTDAFPSLRVTVTQAADLGDYRELLAESLKGAGVQQGVAAKRLSEIFLPIELAQIVMSRNYATMSRQANYDEDRARKVIDSLHTSGAAYSLEAVDMPDRPSIELLDGDTYKESTHLSTGQRCTTILPILLIQSERPLLIDQPEDNLDNAFVYDTIVTALKAVKGSRQVIFVTHNPNIPVLGEAERVFVFSSDGEHSIVQRSGTVDECKDDIERILEGGREAFLQRKLRYGH
jgi:ABC-type uncharacterized transport system ATPase subunit